MIAPLPTVPIRLPQNWGRGASYLRKENTMDNLLTDPASEQLASATWRFTGAPDGNALGHIAQGAGEHLVHRRWFDYVVAWGDPPQPD